ncbi:MAG: hypothetical protein ABSC56_13900 [Solirubrobacteraceae bacterium]
MLTERNEGGFGIVLSQKAPNEVNAAPVAARGDHVRVGCAGQIVVARSRSDMAGELAGGGPVRGSAL